MQASLIQGWIGPIFIVVMDRHGKIGQNLLTRLNLKKTRLKLDFFLPEAKTS